MRGRKALVRIHRSHLKNESLQKLEPAAAFAMHGQSASIKSTLSRFGLETLMADRCAIHLPFDQPLGPPKENERLIRCEICADTGLLASRFSTSRISELFLKGTEPKEDSANWFAADGKLLLPAEYAGWCASSNNTRGAHVRSEPRITNPIANARYEIDPVLPGSQQMIELTATLGDRVQWFVNGTQIAPQPDGRFFWQVARGQWNIRAVSPGGSAEETIFIG